MWSSNRDKVDALNEIAGKTDMSGIDPAMLKLVTGPTRVFAISAGEIVEEGYQKPTAMYGEQVGSRPNQFTKYREEYQTKTSWVEATPFARELEPMPMEGSYWFPVTFAEADFMCIKCRMAKTTLELEQQYSNPATCINCSANCQDQLRMSDPTNTMAMRLRVAFKETGIDHVDISMDFQGWLVFAASSLVANATLGTRGSRSLIWVQ